MDSDNDECLFIRNVPSPRCRKDEPALRQVTLNGFLVKLEPQPLANNALPESLQQSEQPHEQQDTVRPNWHETAACNEEEDEESHAVIIDEDPPLPGQSEIQRAADPDPPAVSDDIAELRLNLSCLSVLPQVVGTAPSFTSNFDDPMGTGDANERPAGYTVVVHNGQPEDEVDQVYIVDSDGDGELNEPDAIYRINGLSHERTPDESGKAPDVAPDLTLEGDTDAIDGSEPNEDASENIQHPLDTQPIPEARMYPSQ